MFDVGTSEIAFTITLATVLLLFYVFFNVFFQKKSANNNNDDDKSVEIKNGNVATKRESTAAANKQKKQNINKNVSKPKEQAFKHKWLSCILKAHSDTVTGIDFSSNGKYLLSCGLDRALFMWSTREFEQQQHKYIRANVEFDNANKVRFSPDSRSFIASLGVGNTIRAFKIVKKDDANMNIMQAAIQDFPQKHKADLINVGISCNAKFIMTCSKDTTITIWDIKGDVLGAVDTRLMNNNYAAVSPCGRFFGACGFTPDVKVWEVCFDKTGAFKEIRRAFELKGHSAGVYHFAYNTDTTRMVSVSKDGTWKLWNTNIDYERGQEANLLLSIKLETIITPPSMMFIAISPDSYSVAVVSSCNNNSLSFYNGLKGIRDQVIDQVCSESVNEICFSNDNKYLAVACDRQIKVFYNLTGKRVAIDDLNESLKTAKTQAAKERMQQQIDEYKKLIEEIEQKE